MKKYFLFPLVLIGLFLISCTSSDAPTSPSQNAKKDVDTKQIEQKYEAVKSVTGDIICPEPTIVYFHSNSVNSGSITTVRPCTLPYRDSWEFYVTDLKADWDHPTEIWVRIDGILQQYYTVWTGSYDNKGSYELGLGLHIFEIRVKNHCVSNSVSDEVVYTSKVEVMSPYQPPAPTITFTSNPTYNSFSWNSVGSGVGYKIYRSLNSGSIQLIGTTTDLSYTDYSVTKWSSAYDPSMKGSACYYVKAYNLNTCGESANYSNGICGTFLDDSLMP